uniref:Secreted protein n=1 Tax=Oryza brachyantha TaxID=4533 RepID=J3LBG3_ORYBR
MALLLLLVLLLLLRAVCEHCCCCGGPRNVLIHVYLLGEGIYPFTYPRLHRKDAKKNNFQMWTPLQTAHLNACLL